MITNLLTVATKIRDMDVLVGAAFLDDINPAPARILSRVKI